MGGRMSDIAFVDFESRSACNIKKTGSWVYSCHSTTDVMCLGFRLPYWKKGRTGLWHPAYDYLDIKEEGVDDLVELFSWILSDGHVAAHNAFFDRGIWQNQAVPRLGWPAIPLRQWSCTAARAAAHALPRSVDDAGAALGLKVVKDREGHKTMLKVSKPRKPRKKEREEWEKERGSAPMPILYHESKELFERLWKYCRQDVLAEQEISNAVPPLSDAEQQMWILDQTINERGFLLDMDAVSCALELINAETTRLNDELKLLTGGSPDKGTQRKKMHDWFLMQWFILEDTKGATVDAALKQDDLSPKVRRGLELLQSLSRSSTAKYEAMRAWACGDGRVRGGLLYHGASTGRWSGAGVQPHNFPKGTIKDIEAAWRVLKTKDRERIERFDPKVKAA
jgi:DNA polymerase